MSRLSCRFGRGAIRREIRCRSTTLTAKGESNDGTVCDGCVDQQQCGPVVGVIATGVAQARGSKTAHANALALFKRQDDEQDEIRSKEATERRRTAFLADRRAVYAKFLLAMRRFENEKIKIQKLKKRYQVLGAELTGSPEPDSTRRTERRIGRCLPKNRCSL